VLLNWKGCEKKRSWPNLKYVTISGFSWRDWGKSSKTLHGKRSPCLDLNPGPSIAILECCPLNRDLSKLMLMGHLHTTRLSEVRKLPKAVTLVTYSGVAPIECQRGHRLFLHIVPVFFSFRHNIL
jgi:hypothetical protein